MFPVLEFGKGLYVVGVGTYDSVASMMITTGGSGVVGQAYPFKNFTPEAEMLKVVFTFDNTESVDVMLEALAKLKENMSETA